MKNQDFKYSGKINYLKAQEWGLSANLCILFDWMYGVPAWAEYMMIDNEIFYFASKNKAISDLVILTNKTDTMYRYYKQLEDKGLIILKKIRDRDYIKLTEKGKSWDRFERSLGVGNKSEDKEATEINPSKVGNKSEGRSEINPTYNSIIYNNSIRDNSEREDKISHTSKDKSIPLKDQKEKEKNLAPKKENEESTSHTNALEFLKNRSPSRFEAFLMQKKKSIGDWENFQFRFNNEVDIKNLEYTERILWAFLGNYANSWIRNNKSRGNQDDEPTFFHNRPQDV